MNELAIRFEDVSRRFGDNRALREFSCSVPVGSVTALLGRNAAGKTTALRCMMGLVATDDGRVTVLGRDASRLDDATRASIGYVSERTGLDPRLNVAQTIAFTRSFYETWDDDLAAELLKKLGLRADQPVSELSLGQGRKLMLLLNLAYRPSLLVLDEPAANLDAVVRREFLEVLLQMFRREGMTVFLSTHLLADVERIADRVVLIEDGALRVESDLDDLKERVKAIRLLPRNGAPVPDIQIDGLLRRRRAGAELQLYVDNYRAGMEAQLAELSGARAEVMHLPLEEIFIAYESSESEEAKR